MGENSGDNSDVVALDVEIAHETSDGDISVEGDHDTKMMISNHPLFGLLIETHINCLKIGLGHDFEEDDEEVVITASNTMVDEVKKTKLNESSSSTNVSPTSPELDKFMEAYFNALNKLKEAIEEPLKEATSFITSMYGQLNDLNMIKNSQSDCQSLVLNHDKECEQPDLA